jgi:hypothetical protein
VISQVPDRGEAPNLITEDVLTCCLSRSLKGAVVHDTGPVAELIFQFYFTCRELHFKSPDMLTKLVKIAVTIGLAGKAMRLGITEPPSNASRS